MFRFIDMREDLPRHETKVFQKRKAEDIKGIVIHHTAGGDDINNTAKYHVGPNHVSSSGCPALLYTFYITKSGIIYWANDLEEVTWSQGGHGSPVAGTNANNNFLGVVCAGDYSKDNPGPPFVQTFALMTLWAHLVGQLKNPYISKELYGAIDCPIESMWGHHNFGKPACPGPTLTLLIDTIRSYSQDRLGLGSVVEWQEALNVWGADIKEDGVWGSASRSALVAFQKADGKLIVDGIRGPISEAHLLAAITVH